MEVIGPRYAVSHLSGIQIGDWIDIYDVPNRSGVPEVIHPHLEKAAEYATRRRYLSALR